MFKKQITAIIKEPDHPARVEYLFDNSLRSFQETVGGRIETVTITSDIVFICNADGRNEGLPFNCRLCNVDFFGTIIIVGAKGDEFTSVRMRQLDNFLALSGW